MTTAAPTPTALADLAPTLSEGRLKWETTSAGLLIRMFAVAGYDVVRNEVLPDRNGCFSRLVKDDDRIVAHILWCDSIPEYAYAFTSSV
jgi:hypothetical protein